MKMSDYDYDLPHELIAQKPTEIRDQSRLLVLDKKTGKIDHRYFREISNFLSAGDILVLNNSKVFKARLIGQQETGGKAEIFLNHELKPGLWQALAKRVKVGQKISFRKTGLVAEVVGKTGDTYEVRFNLSGDNFFDEINKVGQTPLPPYIKKEPGKEDIERYQTVFAKDLGSAAAPTAGLHFTNDLINELRNKGIFILEVTLHVGLGTFAPVKADDLKDHTMHSEFFSIKKEVIAQIIDAKKKKRKVVAVGTTTTRVLEHIFATPDIGKTDLSGWTNIFIYPGYKFNCVDALITNFHLPKSTLLLLVSALAGTDNISKAYKEAINKKYRFFSYGDAMFIE